MAKRPEISVADFTKTIEIEPAAVFPHDAKLFGSAANNGQMIAEIEPKGRCAEIFADLANAVAGRIGSAQSEAEPVRAVHVQAQPQESVRRVGGRQMQMPVRLVTCRRKETKHVR